MQGLKGVIIVATLVAAAVALSGCVGHHEKAAPVHAKTATAVLTKGEKTMQGLKGVIIVATFVAAAIALSGCVGHHEKAVVAEPLKLSSADVVVEQVRV